MGLSFSPFSFLFLRLFRSQNRKIAPPIAVRPATPPTTPPAMAPVGLGELDEFDELVDVDDDDDDDDEDEDEEDAVSVDAAPVDVILVEPAAISSQLSGA